jgi:hypothetical protein
VLYTAESLEQLIIPKGLLIHKTVCDRITTSLRAVVELFGPEAFEEAVRRVHASNMSKLGVDGRPRWREDGKVLKGDTYKAPDLRDLVNPVLERLQQVADLAVAKAKGANV